jgi:transcription termination factor Rho
MQRGKERKSVTDTDLITAGDGADQTQLPMSVTSDAAGTGGGGSLSTMVLPELRALAGKVGVKGTSGMRKSDLIAAIRERQSGGGSDANAPANGAGRNGGGAAEVPAAETVTQSVAPAPEQAPAAAQPTEAPAGEAAEPTQAPRRRERRGASRDAGSPPAEGGNQGNQSNQARQDDRGQADDAPKQDRDAPKQDRDAPRQDRDAARQDRDQNTGDQQGNQQNRGNNGGGTNNARNNSGNNNAGNNNAGNNSNNNNSNNNNSDDDDERGQGRRGRRFRDRRRRGERTGPDGGAGGGDRDRDRDTELREDDVVQPVAGILDVLDNYAFVRTSGYLAGPNDVYVSMNMVRKNGLRRGDAVTGAVRVSKDGDTSNQRQKFNPLVRLDTVNGGPVEDAKKRPDFTKLTPLYPNQRLRLETTPDRLTTRVIDLIMPIGKGQRALIVSPPKAGKTTIMQNIANAITTNNPECHLMVVLVDERPEEVTDMQRSVKGEVIASTFDRPPSDHTQAAELAIERAKRLVEQGKDVVVLLDSITRLGRAYNNASPASGRILSGGVDSTALYPPKRFLGAARNIENGGSLTIIATAMVETGSTGDTVIFEEFKGTGNAELKLDRKIAERRVFPAVDVNPSGTRKDELLLSNDEFGVVHKLRRVLSGLDSHQAIDLLMSQLRKTKTNYEFLTQVSKTTPGNMDND